MNNVSSVVVVKTKQGEDIIGFYLGESDQKQPGMVLYKPLRLTQVSGVRNGRVLYNYSSEFYFPYGDGQVTILYDNVVYSEIANSFFSRLYEKVLGELIVFEENTMKELTAMFDKSDLDSIMEDTDSMYIEQKTEYTQ